MTKKLDEPPAHASLEYLADFYTTVPEAKQQEASSKLGGHQQPEFYQGMIIYLYGIVNSLEASYKEVVESASLVACALVHGLLYQDFGKKKKVVSHPFLDDSIDQENFKKAVETPIPYWFHQQLDEMYGKNQPLAFYEGMFSASVLVFSDAYRKEEYHPGVLHSLMWNYAYLAKIIVQKRKIN